MRVGLDADEADRLAQALALDEERLYEPGFAGFAPFDRRSAIERYRHALEGSISAKDVELAAFAIDLHPVTSLQWAEHMRKTGAIAPERDLSKDASLVTGVSYDEALAYAREYDLDLPTLAEWTLAARNAPRFFRELERYGEYCREPPLIAGGDFDRAGALHLRRLVARDERRLDTRIRCVKRGSLEG